MMNYGLLMLIEENSGKTNSHVILKKLLLQFYSGSV